MAKVLRPTPAPPADLAFEPALRMVVQASYEQASDDRWRRAFPALLLARTQAQVELDRLRSQTEHDERSRFEELLQRGVAEGAIAADVTLDDLMLQIVGPLVLITCGFQDFDDSVADRIVDLFLASHRPTAV